MANSSMLTGAVRRDGWNVRFLDWVVSRLLTVTWVEFRQSASRNTFQHFLREDTQQLPANIQRLENGSVLVIS